MCIICHLSGSSTPLVYVNETCLECERVRAACERLGTVAVAPSPEALPPSQQPPAPPSYLITSPFDGDLFDTAHRAKYRSVVIDILLQFLIREHVTKQSLLHVVVGNS